MPSNHAQRKNLAGIIGMLFFLLAFALLILERNKQLYASQLFDEVTIKILLTATLTGFLIGFNFFTSIKNKYTRSVIIAFGCLLFLLCIANEWKIYRYTKPEIILSAVNNSFLNSTYLYLRSDSTYKTEQRGLLDAHYNYGTYTVHHDTLLLNAEKNHSTMVASKFLPIQTANNALMSPHDSLIPMHMDSLVSATKGAFDITLNALFR